ncbi:MAG: transcriptional repressor [Bacilli bacterium]|nr:transcriptional repressor [Bacilli bacterium]
MTKLMQSLYDILNNSCGHLKAYDIHKICLEKGIKGSLSSVYRCLNLLVEEGYISRIRLGDGEDIFDKTITPHGHMICECCGKVKDIEVPNIQDHLGTLNDGKILSYDLKIKYICNDCIGGMGDDK